MSTVLDTISPTVNIPPSHAASAVPVAVPVPAISEGDWQTYIERVATAHAPLEYKRQCAFAYLGKRAQNRGGVCGKKPRVLSEEVVTRLRETNRAKRYARYPWIEKLLALMADIERLQDEQAAAQNVLSLVPPTKTN